MTKREALAIWRESVLPAVRAQYETDGRPDYPARCQAWNDWTDGLCKSKQITERQYATWTHPPSNSPKRARDWTR